MPDFRERDRFCRYCGASVWLYEEKNVCESCDEKLRGPFAQAGEWAARLTKEAPTVVTGWHFSGECITVSYDHYHQHGWMASFSPTAVNVSWYVSHTGDRETDQSSDTGDLPFSHPDFFTQLLGRVQDALNEIESRRDRF